MEATIYCFDIQHGIGFDSGKIESNPHPITLLQTTKLSFLSKCSMQLTTCQLIHDLFDQFFHKYSERKNKKQK